MFNNKFLGIVVILLLGIIVNGQEDVEGYGNRGRGSCQDQRGLQFSYLQRTVEFPNAETCGKQECERFANSESYRGFEYSVANRCTCLFDIDDVPVVPNDAEDGKQKYLSKPDGGQGPVMGTSGTPGAYCYSFGVSNELCATSKLCA